MTSSDQPNTPEPSSNPPAGRPGGKRTKQRSRVGCFAVLLVLVVALALVGGGGLAAGYLWLEHWSEKPYGPRGAVRIKIKQGTTSRRIAEELRNHHLISDERSWLIWLKISGNMGRIQAGEYTLEPPLAPIQVAMAMRHGAFEKELTIPEGWTSRQIAKRLVVQKWLAKEQEWLDLVSSPTQLIGESLPLGVDGFLFPDTYRFAEGTSAAEIKQRMLDQFLEQWKAARPDERSTDSQQLSMLEVVTLASMIEREARVAEEMPRIASVYLNRLGKRIKLQCCATVYYSLGEAAWARPLTFADLKTNSPYNTYLNPGLPPGPIANPGRPAIEAVLRPEKTDYLFYVYRGDNHHIFSRTAKEHDQAVKSVRVKNPQADIVRQKSD